MNYFNNNNKTLAMQTDNNPLIKGVTTKYRSLIFYILHNGITDKHTVEDLYSKVCERILNVVRDGKYIDEGKERAFIGRITRNIQMDYFRSQRTVGNNAIMYHDDREIVLKTDLMVDPTPNEEEVIHFNEEIKELHKNIEYLTPEIGEAIKLRYFRHMSFLEIAEEQQCSINTALGRVRYGIKNLRKMRNN